MPQSPSSLGEALRAQTANQADSPAITFLKDGERDEVTWTFGELDLRARAIAARLFEEGVVQGDRALILHPPGLDLVAAFFGCQYAGVVPTLTYPPAARAGSRSQQRLKRLIHDAQCRILLRSGADRNLDASLPELRTDAVDLSAAASFRERSASPEDIAFLQYTSGSTREPRGVVVSQRNALVNLGHLADVSRARSPDVRVVMWVPPYHDLGLVGGVLMPIASGFPTHLMDPRHFMQRPMRWLEAIGRYRATATGAPDSAYDACARSAQDQDLVGLDLSCWTIGVNGAETVRPETLRRFSERFAPCGFRPETLYPCYGLAESTLIVSGGAMGSRWREVPAPAEAQSPRSGGSEGSAVRTAVGLGQAIPGHKILIVDSKRRTPCGPAEVGEIWVRGPCVAKGYWNRLEETEATFRAELEGVPGTHYLRTGDLGCFADGELVMAGRIKDLILLNGRNLFPQDIEETMEASHPAIEPRACAAFSIDTGALEVLVALAEVRRTERRHIDPTEVLETIRRAVGRGHEVAIHAAMLLPPGSLPRTTSGKIQRTDARRLFQSDGLRPLASFDRTRPTHVTPAASLSSRPGTIEERLRLQTAALLRVSVNEVPLDVPLRDIGLDSLMRVELLLCLDPGSRTSLPNEALEGVISLREVASLTRKLSVPSAASTLLPSGSEIPLTARQRAFFEQPGLTQRERFGIQVRLRTLKGLDVEALGAALRSLSDAHEALRLRFRQNEGRWRQVLGEAPSSEILERIDISQSLPGQLLVQSEELDRKLIGGVDLEHGPLLRALFLDRGPGETGMLSVFFHHLVTDAISVAILLGDLTRSYEDRLQKAPLSPPSYIPGFAAWCQARGSREASAAEASDRGTQESRSQWLDPALEDERALPPPDRPQPPGSLDPGTDARLLKRFPQSRDIEAVLLAAFAWAFTRRISRPLRVEIQSHGRWPRYGIDPRFSVGWFASLHTLEFPMSGGASETDLLLAARDALRTLHEARGTTNVAGAGPRANMEYRSIIEDTFRPGALFPILDVVWWSPPRTIDPFEKMDISLLSGHRRGRLWWSLGANPRVYATSTVLSIATDIKAYLERAGR